MFYKIVSLGKGYNGWGSYHLGKSFSSIQEAVSFVNTTFKEESSIDYNKRYCIFIENSNGEIVAIHNCFGWQYK